MTIQIYTKQEEKHLQDIARLYLIAGRCPEILDSIKFDTREIDWQKILAYAEDQFVLPLLYRNLNGSSVLPTELEESLRSTYLETARINLSHVQSLKELLVLFRNDQIDCIVLKGLSLAVGLYGNIAVRPSRDIDLLLHLEDIPSALKHTLSVGYQFYNVPLNRESDLQFENEILLYNPESEIFLELHWSLFDSPHYQSKLDLSWFWNPRIPVNVGTTTIMSLAAEANLIYLCGHLVYHHKGNELLWLNDIAELISQSQVFFDWETIIEKAGEFQLTLPIRQVLEHIRRYWRVPVPEEVLQALNHNQVSDEEKRVFAALMGGRPSAGKQFWIDFISLSGWEKRFNYALSSLFPSFEYMRERYKVEKIIFLPLFYIYRWWLGIRSYLNGHE